MNDYIFFMHDDVPNEHRGQDDGWSAYRAKLREARAFEGWKCNRRWNLCVEIGCTHRDQSTDSWLHSHPRRKPDCGARTGYRQSCLRGWRNCGDT